MPVWDRTGWLPPLLSAWTMYVVQMTVNVFIPSGSTKAALTMPLMAPLADLSGITIGTLAMARIPYGKWWR